MKLRAAIGNLAVAMQLKLLAKKSEGFYGWDDPKDIDDKKLSDLLRDSVRKGDPVDVANYCMMLHARGGRIV